MHSLYSLTILCTPIISVHVYIVCVCVLCVTGNRIFFLSFSLLSFLYICSEDITEVYPLSRIEQEVREQKDMFGALDLHETYYKVSVCTCVCMYDYVCTNVFV